MKGSFVAVSITIMSAAEKSSLSASAAVSQAANVMRFASFTLPTRIPDVRREVTKVECANTSIEFRTVAPHLEVDCRNTFGLLRFLRATASKCEEFSLPRAVKGRGKTAMIGSGGWYRRSLALMQVGQDFACPT